MKHICLNLENWKKQIFKKSQNKLSQSLFILNSNKFKAIFLIIIFTCIFNLFNIENGIAYEEAIFSSITSTLFLFVIIGILFISSCITLDLFDKEFGIILRYKNKLRYLKELLKLISLVNLIIFGLAISITILFTTFKYFGITTFDKMSNYNIPFIVYNLFTITKYYIIINILSLIGICLYKNFGKILCYIYYALIIILYYTYPVSNSIITNFNIKNLFFKYYIYPFQYANFYLELSFAIIFICLMLLIVHLAIYATVKYNKIKINE